jgi:cell surface protein SprA
MTYPQSAGAEWAGKPYNAANGGVELYSADVMVPAFLSAYCGGNAISSPLDIFPALARLMPNWSVKYGGLTKLFPWFADKFKSFNINHAYKSVYSVGAYNSYSSFMEYMGEWGFISDVTTGNPIPSSMYNVSTVSINESFSPLIGVDMTFNNGLTAKLNYNKTRTLNLSMTSVALTENFSNDIVIGMGYKIKDLNLFGAKSIQDPNRKKSKKSNNDDEANSRTTTRTRSSVSHDLNIRADFSYRMQNALNRNIQTAITTATSGATAYKIAISADYTFSRLLTLSGFLDWQKNVPLVSQSSYPTITADFGVSMKFSLTR